MKENLLRKQTKSTLIQMGERLGVDTRKMNKEKLIAKLMEFSYKKLVGSLKNSS